MTANEAKTKFIDKQNDRNYRLSLINNCMHCVHHNHYEGDFGYGEYCKKYDQEISIDNKHDISDSTNCSDYLPTILTKLSQYFLD